MQQSHWLPSSGLVQVSKKEFFMSGWGKRKFSVWLILDQMKYQERERKFLSGKQRKRINKEINKSCQFDD